MFETALTLVLRNEGGYANHPKDPGGPTNFGITQATYDRYRQSKHLPQSPVRIIAQHEIKEIYRGIWRDCKADIISTFKPYLAIAHFDCAVNTGNVQAAKILQRAVLADDDGIIGPKTLKALRVTEPDIALRNALEWREAFYEVLIKRKPQLKIFHKTWLRRIQAIRDYVEYIQKRDVPRADKA
jgi:lysozyme family protein